MKTPTEEAIDKKFEALLKEGTRFMTAVSTMGSRPLKPYISPAEYQRFTTQVINLVEKVCGRKSAHYENAQKCAATNLDIEDFIGILQAAHSDYADGFLAEIRYLVRADLLEDFLTQADALLQNGYHAAAASLAGAVLEDTLRKLCDKYSIRYNPAKTSIEVLNTELVKAAVYDKLVQKEITAKAHLRNEADHGRFGNVKEPDVKDMLHWVQRFVSEHLK